MSVAVSNLVLGPATVYQGAFGAVEPADSTVNSTPAASAWTDVGGTMGGVTFAVNQTYTELEVDQIVDSAGRRLTKRDITVATQMAELTLQNLALALNGGTVVTGSGATPSTYDPATAISATQPSYTALLFDGWSPQQFRRRGIVRKCLSTANVELAYKKDGQSVYGATWNAHYVSSSITPFHVVDANQ
jgi:N-acetylglucosamine-6-phosphate deacetylase